MTDQDKTPDTIPAAETAGPATVEAQPAESRRFVWLAVGSLILTIIAWIAGTYSGIAAIVVSALAILCGALALKSHRNTVRNTAITSIIAAAVLLVVVAAFFIVIYIGLKSV